MFFFEWLAEMVVQITEKFGPIFLSKPNFLNYNYVLITGINIIPNR